MEIVELGVKQNEDGSRLVKVVASMDRGEDFEADDAAQLLNALDELNGAVGSRDTSADEEPEDEKPKRRRKSKKDEEPEEEPEEDEDEEEAEPKKPRRRRKSKKTDDDEAEAKPRRRRKSKKDEEPEDDDEEEEEKPKRHRKGKAKGPTKEDVAKAASSAAEELGSDLTAEIIMEYSKSGKLDDIPAGKRQAFIDEIENELADDGDDDDGED